VRVGAGFGGEAELNGVMPVAMKKPRHQAMRGALFVRPDAIRR
jgi:hypothetical protein